MQREVSFESHGANIYGTLTLPDEGKKPPACLFIHGSFPQTRDGDIDNSRTDWFPNPLPARKLFLDEAEVLKRIGIATFRYDKRGSGKSEGDTNAAALLGLVDDARNALRWLRDVPEIDAQRVGLLGQSEGTLINLMLAAEDPEIHFCVLQGSFYNRGDVIFKWQTENFWKLSNEAIDSMKQNVPLIYWIYKQMDDCISSAQQGEDYIRLGDESWSFDWNLEWIRDYLDNPPAKFATKVRCPVLLLQGELDHNTPATEVPLLKEALIQGGNPDVTAHIFPGLDHSFRRLGHPDEDFVTAMKRPLDPIMVEALTGWLQAQLNLG